MLHNRLWKNPNKQITESLKKITFLFEKKKIHSYNTDSIIHVTQSSNYNTLNFKYEIVETSSRRWFADNSSDRNRFREPVSIWSQNLVILNTSLVQLN